MGRIAALAGDFRESKPFRREIYRMSWPAILEQSLVMLVGIVSTMFVGRLSTEAMAAVGFVNMIIQFLQAVFAALSTGATVVVARLIGEEDPAQAKLAALNSLILAVLSAAAVTLLCFVFSNPILNLFMGEVEQVVFENAQIYYTMTLLSLPFMIVSLVVGGALRGAGDMKSPMYVAGITNIVNIALSYVLIYGLGPIKPLGVLGAGIATLTSRAVGAVAILLVLYKGKTPIKLGFKDGFKINIPIVKRILHVGLPASMEQVVMQGGFLMMQVLIKGLGTVPMATYQVANSVNSLAFMPIYGLSLAATTLVGQNLGRRKPDIAQKSAVQCIFIAVLWISGVGLLIYLFRWQLAGLYSSDPAVIALAASVLPILAIAEPVLGVLNITSGALRGAGDVRFIMITSIISIWGVRILLTMLFTNVLHTGFIGVYYSLLLDFVIRAGLYLHRFQRGKWKYLTI